MVFDVNETSVFLHGCYILYSNKPVRDQSSWLLEAQKTNALAKTASYTDSNQSFSHWESLSFLVCSILRTRLLHVPIIATCGSSVYRISDSLVRVFLGQSLHELQQ